MKPSSTDPQVYGVDPLECPKCPSTMRLIAVIDDPAVIRRILKHLRQCNPHPAEPEHPGARFENLAKPSQHLCPTRIEFALP